MKFITLINDCSDDNAKARQTTRWSTLFPSVNVSFVGINSSLGINATLEAGGNLVDILDASGGERGIVALNVAPRGQIKEDGINGSRFCYFYYRQTLVLSTIKGYNLSLVKKFKITKQINILDTDEVLDFAYKHGLINQKLKNYISQTQFRSLDFQPRVAKWITQGFTIPSHKSSLEQIPDIPDAVWCVDSFGNVKSTLTDYDHKRTKFKYYKRLKDVPDGETAIYHGSSGLGGKRFIEIATQNRVGSAAGYLELTVGDPIKL